MEKPKRTNRTAKIFKYLPKSTSFSVPNPSKAAAFSGPIVSIIPKEARRKKSSEAFDAQEPTSPKVSCIGQIKHKKKSTKKKPSKERETEREREREMKPQLSAIRRMFRQKVRPGRSGDDEGRPAEAVAVAVAVAPPIGKMRRFTSGRETLAGFDWTKAERGFDGGSDDDDDYDDEVIVPHSAPILVGGGAVAVEPRKEVNLWKRRTLAPPVALQV